jgi:hypothetical protein
MFQPKRPSSGVQVVVIQESATQCKAALFLLHSCLGLHLVIHLVVHLVVHVVVHKRNKTALHEQQILSSQQPVHLKMAS